MDNPALIMVLLFCASIVLVIFIASAVRWLSHSDALAVFAGSSFIPILFIVGIFIFVKTMGPDDPPPGPIIFGNLIASAKRRNAKSRGPQHN